MSSSTPPPSSQPPSDSGQPADRHGPLRPQHSPALKRTVVRPASSTPDPVDAAFVANRLTTLTHELSNLLDGSLRIIGLAQRALSSSASEHRDLCPEQLARQLSTVAAAMMQMAELVRTTTIGMAEGGSAGLRPGFGASSSLCEAIHHAADVMTPLAEDNRIRIDVEIAPDLSDLPAGPIFPVITNAIRNAIESIQRVSDRHGNGGGNILVRAWTQPGKTGSCIILEVTDNGAGIARSSMPSVRGTDPVFTLGYTTKPGGSGIGLALSRDVVEQLGGTIELIPRESDPNSGRSGATLSVRYPLPNFCRKAAG